jgi:hypothetical protein
MAHQIPAMLNRDVARVIEDYCFGAFAEFWRRHRKDLACAYTSFRKAMNIEYVKPSIVDAIEAVAGKLGLVEAGTEVPELARALTRRRFRALMDAAVREEGMALMDALAYYRANRQFIF